MSALNSPATPESASKRNPNNNSARHNSLSSQEVQDRDRKDSYHGGHANESRNILADAGRPREKDRTLVTGPEGEGKSRTAESDCSYTQNRNSTSDKTGLPDPSTTRPASSNRSNHFSASPSLSPLPSLHSIEVSSTTVSSPTLPSGPPDLASSHLKNNRHTPALGEDHPLILQSFRRATRSRNNQFFISLYDWEAQDIARQKELTEAKAAEESSREASSQKELLKKPQGRLTSQRTETQGGKAKDKRTAEGRILQSRSSPSKEMSRTRPRATGRENSQAANEEIEMWSRIKRDILKAKEKNDKQAVLAQKIDELNKEIEQSGRKPTLAELNELESYHQQILKHGEEEKAIINDEPHDLIKNLEILLALRCASEAAASTQPLEIPASSRANGKVRKRKALDLDPHDSTGMDTKPLRSKGHTYRTAGTAKDTFDSHSGEEISPFRVGAEVVYRHSKKQQGVEGEGIQCIIKSISGEGTKRRYEVQDPEPNEKGEEGAIYRTSAAYLISIPPPGAPLPVFPASTQVWARYPDTTTFYRAEVAGMKRDVYRLKFEGEEDDKEMEVDRRFVLDISGR